MAGTAIIVPVPDFLSRLPICPAACSCLRTIGLAMNPHCCWCYS